MNMATVEGEARGFAYRMRKNGDVVITHHGRQAAVLKGKAATAFMGRASRGNEQDAQQVMARVTGNYRRGNERLSSQHSRSGGRKAIGVA